MSGLSAPARRRAAQILVWGAAGAAALACDPISEPVLIDCRQADHCDAHEVCYLSFCRAPGGSDLEVFADVAPPSNAGLLAHSDRQARPLIDQLEQPIRLQSPVTLSGSIHAAGVVRTGVLRVTKQNPSPPLPASLEVRKVLVTETGFALEVLPFETYALEFSPLEATPRPPRTYTAVVGADPVTLDLDYWLDGDLVPVHGVVRPQQSLTFVQDAAVEGRLLDGSALRSSPGLTNAAGEYEIVFPPTLASTFAITVRQAFIPTATLELGWDTPPAPGVPGVLVDFVLDLRPASTVLTLARDADGEPIADAVVSFAGDKVGVGVLSLEATTDDTGQTLVTLLPGRYTVTLLPPLGSSAAMTSQVVCVAEPGDEEAACGDGVIDVSALPRAGVGVPIELSAAPKVRLEGRVLDANGTAVAEAHLSLRHLSAHQSRVFVADTNSRGDYALEVDPGLPGEPRIYELVAEPPASADRPLARRVRTLEISEAPLQEQNLELTPSALAHGRVIDSRGLPVNRARVAMYATDVPPGTSDAPLLIGLGQTNDLGEYVFPIPAEP